VLAGGLATRLGELTQSTPKALIEIAGQPFLRWQLELFAARGLTDVVLCIGHHADQIEAWVAANPIAGLTVRFSRDGSKPLGTGGALRRALPLLSSPFLVTYGDSYLRCDYLDVWRAFVASRSSATEAAPLGLMTVFENRGHYDTSNIVYREGRILRYAKGLKSPDMQHIDYGLGVLTAAAFDGFEQDEALDLAQVYQALLSAGRLGAYAVGERFYEVGSRAGIDEFAQFVGTQNESR
jgi:NDP-sugar pyrophosphorylase family protein